MKIFLPLILFLITLVPKHIVAQTHVVEYKYDKSGNRSEKKIIMFKSDDPSNSMQQEIIEEKLEQQEYNDILDEQHLSIYPNPTQGQLVIEIKNIESDLRGSVAIYNSEGKLISEKKRLQSHIQFDISGQPPGVYFMRFQAKKEMSNWKIIKQ